MISSGVRGIRAVRRNGVPLLMLLVLSIGGILSAVSFPAAHASGPSTVGTTGTAYGLGYSSDDYTCGANGRFWVFYSDGTSWGWQSSTDGQTWSARATFPTAVPPPQPGTNDMVFDCSGNTVYYAGGKESMSDTRFYFDTGTLNPDGSISWGAESSQSTLGYLDGYPSIALDSVGNVWLAVQTQNTGGGGPAYVEVWERTSGWASSLTLSFPTYAPIPQVVALTAGKMALLYGTGSTPIGLETLSGSLWTAGPPTPASNYVPEYSAAVSIGDTVDYCASDGTNAYFLSYAYGGAAWSSATTVAAAKACSPTTDGTSVLGLFYVSSATTIAYEQSDNGGSTFAPPVTVSTSEAGVGWIGAGLAVSSNPAKQAMAVWISGSPSTGSVRFSNLSTAPVVDEDVTITDANPAPAASAVVSGCHATVAAIPIDGAAHTFGADPSCSLTISVPTDGTYTRFRFAGGSGSWTFATGTTSPDVHADSAYYQFSVTASYSVSGGSGTPAAPALTSAEAGSAFVSTLTGVPTVYWLDGGASWSVPPSLTSGATTWTTAPSSGTVSGPAVMEFVYSPPVTVTTTSTATTTLTSTSTVTSPTTVTSTVTSTTTLSTATVTSTTTSTSVSTVTGTTTTTASGGPSGVPTASSLTCDQVQTQANHKVHCTDVVFAADEGLASGSVAWGASGGGTFSNQQCNGQGNDANGQLQCEVQYAPGASGVQELTATYSGDPYHSSSAGTFVVFVGNLRGSQVTTVSLACDQAYLNVGGSTNCRATVYAADGGSVTGTMGWSSTDGGTFSHANCSPHGDSGSSGQLQCSVRYTPGSAGPQNVTAAYSGDAGHLSSAGKFEVFVIYNAWSAAQPIASAVSGGSLVGIGLSVMAAAVTRRAGRKGQP